MRFKIEDVVFRLDVPLNTEVVDAITYDAMMKTGTEAVESMSKRNHELAAELDAAKLKNSVLCRKADYQVDRLNSFSQQNTQLLAEVNRLEARADKAEKRLIASKRWFTRFIILRDQVQKEKVDATCKRNKQESGKQEYQDRASSGQAAKASNCDSTVSSWQVKAKSEAQKVTGPYNPTNAKRTIFVPGLGEVVAYDPKPFDYQANGGQDATIEKIKEAFKVVLFYFV